MKIPTISVKNLWHWGDLNINHRYQNGTSLEGSLFSMSACPSAWEEIARLGGSQLHVRDQSSELLDMQSVLYGVTPASKYLRRLIESWALSQGLVEYREVYQVHEFDDEMDDTRITEFLTLAEAVAEADLIGEEPKVVHKLIGTPALNHSHLHPESSILGFEYAVIDWAKANLKGHIQGVYWNECLDPLSYSAPRAGMFDSNTLGLKPAPFVPDDSDGLSDVDEVRWIMVKGLEPGSDEPTP